MARFRARAPRAGTVDVKRLIYTATATEVIVEMRAQLLGQL